MLLAAATAALQWLDYRRLAQRWPSDFYIALIALGFLAFGVTVGLALRRGRPSVAGNPAAVASLGISPRELDVLHEIAAGHSNKEIARRLGVSPNTVKTHAARLFEKLGAVRRTDAVRRAQELGITR